MIHQCPGEFAACPSPVLFHHVQDLGELAEAPAASRSDAAFRPVQLLGHLGVGRPTLIGVQGDKQLLARFAEAPQRLSEQVLPFPFDDNLRRRLSIGQRTGHFACRPAGQLERLPADAMGCRDEPLRQTALPADPGQLPDEDREDILEDIIAGFAVETVTVRNRIDQAAVSSDQFAPRALVAGEAGGKNRRIVGLFPPCSRPRKCRRTSVGGRCSVRGRTGNLDSPHPQVSTYF